jgi:D-glycerate 3-kinase
LVDKWEGAKAARIFDKDAYHGRLASLDLKHVSFINDALRQYDALTEYVLEECFALISADFW